MPKTRGSKPNKTHLGQSSMFNKKRGGGTAAFSAVEDSKILRLNESFQYG